METIVRWIGELWAERRRVALVVLGVVWGTMSLTLLLAFGRAMVAATTRTSEGFGTGLLCVGAGGQTMPHRGTPAGRWIARVPEDADVVRDVPGVAAVAIECSRGGNDLRRPGGGHIVIPVVGCDAAFGKLRRQTPQPGGRYLNPRDIAEHRRVIFLGYRTCERLFGTSAAVGESVKLWDTAFTVVGVLEEKLTVSNYDGFDRDKVSIPWTTFQDLRGGREINSLWVQFVDPGDGPEDRRAVIDGVFAALAARHGIHADDRAAVWTFDYVEIEELVGGILGGLRVFTMCVGLIGILVALVGVANVSYVMVEERTREIGVKMALGARPRDVLGEHLLESVLVTAVGGLIGLVASAVVLRLLDLVELGPAVRSYLGHPSVSWPLGCAVVAVLVAGGVLAGWVPARRAASLDPIQALREE